jgi:hypothetical protein
MGFLGDVLVLGTRARWINCSRDGCMRRHANRDAGPHDSAERFRATWIART